MKRAIDRSGCPINFTTEIVGDTWAMLILRDMLAVGKSTFSQFMNSDEKIGSSVLSEKLEYLEKRGIIKRKVAHEDRRKVIYKVTEHGRDFIPIIYEFAVFGSSYAPKPVAHPAWFKAMKLPRDKVIRAWYKSVEAGDSFFVGEESAIKLLGLV